MGGSREVKKVIIFLGWFAHFCSYLTEIYHFCPFFARFCPFFVRFCPFLSQFFFSKKCNFRPFKAILDRIWPFWTILRSILMFLRLRKHCIYLPKQVSFFDPQSTMYFLASSLHSSAKYVHFCLNRCDPRAKNTYLASLCSSSAKKYIVELGSKKLTFREVDK